MDQDFAAADKPRVDPQLLRSMMKKSDRAGAIQLGSHLLAICATGLGLWFTWGSWWGVPFFVLHGMLINWLYAAQHETSHETVFRTRWINEAVGRFTGFVLMFPRDYDRWQHLCHHRHTQDPEKDAELVYRSLYNGRLSGPLALIGITYWLSLWATMIQHAVTGRRIPVSEYYLSDDQERRVVLEARVHLALYAALIAGSIALQTWAVVILWWAPMLATAWTHQVQNFIEHGGMPHISDTWRSTRTVKTNPAMHWLSWQMVYHTAHHTYPGVPFHRLPDLHAAIVEARGEQPVTQGYFAHVGDVLRETFASKREEAAA